MAGWNVDDEVSDFAFCDGLKMITDHIDVPIMMVFASGFDDAPCGSCEPGERFFGLAFDPLPPDSVLLYSGLAYRQHGPILYYSATLSQLGNRFLNVDVVFTSDRESSGLNHPELKFPRW